MEISRDTFKDSDNSTQNLILFDSIKDMCDKIDAFNSGCNSKHDQLDGAIKRSGKVNKGISAGSGLFGGFLAVILSKLTGV